MNNTDLIVNKPFFVLNVGDHFVYDEKSNSYISRYAESTDDYCSYSSVYTISVEYACKLIKDGFLVEAVDKQQAADNKKFKEMNEQILSLTEQVKELEESAHKYKEMVDRYDKMIVTIDTLNKKYERAIANPNNENLPKCLQVEQETVLKNLRKLTNHLLNIKY